MAVLVVHTTETPPGTAQAVARNLLRDGKAPHQVYDPSDGTVVHCHDWDTPAKALKNLAGGVETNRRGGVIQVEIVGYAAEAPFQSADWYTNLGRYLNRVCDQTGVPKVFPCGFVGGEGYGRRAAQRLSHAAWLTVEGIVGHQHVPENDHWDPGALDVARLSPHLQGDDVTPQDIATIVNAVNQHTLDLHRLENQYRSDIMQRTIAAVQQTILDSEVRQNAAILAGIGGLLDSWTPEQVEVAITALPDAWLKAIGDAVNDEAARRLGLPG